VLVILKNYNDARNNECKMNVHCCLIFERKQPQITYTHTGIANSFSNRRSYLDVAPACSTDAFLLSQVHMYKVVSDFMIGPQTDYKHEHSMSLATFFFLSFIAKKLRTGCSGTNNTIDPLTNLKKYEYL